MTYFQAARPKGPGLISSLKKDAVVRFTLWRKTDKGSDHLLEKANFDEFSNLIDIQVLYTNFSLEIEDSEYVKILGTRSFLTQKKCGANGPTSNSCIYIDFLLS